MTLPQPLPLFPGAPGGPELFVIFVIALIVFGLPLLIITLGGLAFFRRSERIAELEERIRDLEADERDDDQS